MIRAIDKPSAPGPAPFVGFLGTEDFGIRDTNERQLKLLDAQGNLDLSVVSRIMDMKGEYEKQIDGYAKEKVMDTIKIETLAKKIQENE